MAGTRIIQCTCKHEFQDAQYGKGMRVHNMSNDNTKAYCTVCCIDTPPKINPTNGKFIRKFKITK